MATMKDVADYLGLSLTTVSRVLNNRGYTSTETRNRVYAAMKELDYQPNELARSLQRKRSNNIGIILPSGGEFNYMMLSAVEHYCYELGYRVTVCVSNSEVEREKTYAAMLRANKIDGIILRSHTKDISAFKGIDLPVVAIERGSNEGVVSVNCDNYSGGEMATRHLIECGCRNLVCIGRFSELDLVGSQRMNAFIDVCREAGVEYRVIDDDSGVTATRICSDYPEVDGIFASGDMLAVRCLTAAMALGRRVPEDIKVVGFDGAPVTDTVWPNITTVVQPIEEMGRNAVRLIVDMIEKRSVPKQIELPVSLRVRGSTVAGLNCDRTPM